MRALLWAFWTPTTVQMQRDLVVRESESQQEVYREGPYDGITVARPMDQLIQEINKVGLDQFLRTHRLEEGRVGPVRRSSGRTGFAHQWLMACRAWASTAVHRIRGR
jgi:hypothetical protein